MYYTYIGKCVLGVMEFTYVYTYIEKCVYTCIEKCIYIY